MFHCTDNFEGCCEGEVCRAPRSVRTRSLRSRVQYLCNFARYAREDYTSVIWTPWSVKRRRAGHHEMSKSKENSSQKCTQKNQNRQNLVKNVKRSRTSRESSQNTRGSLTRCIEVNTGNRKWQIDEKCKKVTKIGKICKKNPKHPGPAENCRKTQGDPLPGASG